LAPKIWPFGVWKASTTARKKLVDGFDFNPSTDSMFCEPCTEGKHKRAPFPNTTACCVKEPLELVHSDVCGKIGSRSLSGAEYFMTFVDDCTHYTWVYVLKNKSDVFDRFCEWKALVEKLSGQQVKTLRTDNGGEYTSTRFKNYLAKEGIQHKLTVPKDPEQNGVSERMNQTLLEAVRSMLADSKLPHKFWAEALSTAVF